MLNSTTLQSNLSSMVLRMNLTKNSAAILSN
ncbi:uncharacterized protein METZ01_LOCUS310063 [marine metagenome]|uniref:Uncharacterized protein n=1 Tax=marine metagenome TaxID=408172 RepID=A0A382N7Q4_9ZZZZ